MEEVHQKLGNLLLKGWTMLSNSCPMCLETPLMRSRDKRIYCGKCDIYLAHDMQSIEHTNIVDKEIDHQSISSENFNKKLDFKTNNNVVKITNIPMSDDSMHQPNWNPDKYLNNQIIPKLLDFTIDIISKRLEKYVNLLEKGSLDPVDVERYCDLTQGIATNIANKRISNIVGKTT